MRLPPQLTSASHPLCRQARQLGKGVKERREEGLFLVEGPRGLEEALAAGVEPVWVLVAASRSQGGRLAELAFGCVTRGIPAQPVADKLLRRLAPSENGPGLLAACRLPSGADEPARVLAAGEGVLALAWAIQDPGSIGTLVRSAAAFGAAGLLAVGGADPWNPKAVRASAGALHRLPVARSASEEPEPLLDALHEGGWRCVASLPRGGVSPEECDWSGRVALMLGAEVAGLPEALVEAADARVSIPMSDTVESLSVPVAGSLLLAAAR